MSLDMHPLKPAALENTVDGLATPRPVGPPAARHSATAARDDSGGSPEPPRFVRALAHAALRDPDSPAVVGRSGVTSYGKLLDDAEQVLGQVRSCRELAAGQPVAVLAERNATTVSALLACLLGGHPALVLSPALPQEVRDRVISDAGAALLVTSGDVETLPGARSPRRPDDTALILATSGSTGAPKGVLLPGRSIDRFVDWARTEFGIGPGHRALSLAPLSFDISLLDVWATLASGGTVVLPSTFESLRGATVLDQVRLHRVRMIQAVPLFFSQMRGVPEPCPQVEHVVVTGAAVEADALDTIRRLFPAARVSNVYGATETNDTFLHVVTDQDTAPLPIGRPLTGVDTAVLDVEGRVVIGAGTGELWVRSPFSGTGYTDPERDAGRWGADPRTGDGPAHWFRTGDIVVRAPDGGHRLTGRADRQAKVRGVAINLDHIESVLLLHPTVTEAAARVEEDPQGGQRVCAAIRHGEDRPSALDLKQHCGRHLAAAAVPGRIVLTGNALPRTTTGKLDRNAIVDTLP